MINNSSYIGQFITDIKNYYDFLKELGSGSYGQVWRVQNKLTGEIQACKKLNKKSIKNKERYKVEIELMKAIDHHNIVKLYEVYEDVSYLYLIMEECVGGDFFDRLASRAKSANIYTEKMAAELFKQIMSSLNYCHSHGVSHRDIKPENILFTGSDDASTLKLIDFGLSKLFGSQGNAMKSVVGTTYYMAPEVLKGHYDERCDVWSAGVILYIMLCGRPPFYGKNDEEIMRKIQKKNYHFEYPEWNKVSKDVKELIKSIFVDVNDRPNAQEILEHLWVSQLAPNSTNEVIHLDIDHVSQYAKSNKLQKSVISYCAYRLKDDETRNLVNIFNSFDANNDGVISLSELERGLVNFKSKGFESKDIEKLFEDIDLDKNGLINFNEFLSATINYSQVSKQEVIFEAFRAFDKDGNGKLSYGEICDIIKPQTKEDLAYIKNLLEKMDLNKDGEIDFEEFMLGMENEEIASQLVVK